MPSRDQPTRPNLEQFKNQVKDLLKAYRVRVSFAFARLRESFAQLSDASGDDLVRQSLTLCDAQQVLALEYGFPSWSHMQTLIERGENVLMLKMTVEQPKTSSDNYQQVVVLKAKEVNRYLLIWIGPAKTDSIAMKLKGE